MSIEERKEKSRIIRAALVDAAAQAVADVHVISVFVDGSGKVRLSLEVSEVDMDLFVDDVFDLVD